MPPTQPGLQPRCSGYNAGYNPGFNPRWRPIFGVQSREQPRVQPVSINSALNAMSSTFVNDFYRHKWRDRGEEHYLFVGRAGVMVGGVILGLFGVLCFFWKQSSDIPLVDFALLVMAFAYSGLVAVFLTVMLTNRGSNLSVIAALVVGFLIVLVMQKAVWTSITPQSWHDLKIAFPWQMLLATLIAFAVCCLGKQPRDL